MSTVDIERKQFDSSFNEDMALDVQDLDRAALDQPAIFKKWGKEWADAIWFRDNIKDKIKAKRADLAKQIRANPEKFGAVKDKIAENWLNSTIDCHEEVLALEKDFTAAQYEVNMMQVAKEGCEQRSRSLNQLIELYKGQYFSAVSRGSASHVTAIEHSMEKQREKIEKKLTKKK